MFEFLFGSEKKTRKTKKTKKMCKSRRRCYNVAASPCNQLKIRDCKSRKYCNYTVRGCRRAKGYATMPEYIAIMGTIVSKPVAQIAMDVAAHSASQGDNVHEVVKKTVEAIQSETKATVPEAVAAATHAVMTSTGTQTDETAATVAKEMVQKGADQLGVSRAVAVVVGAPPPPPPMPPGGPGSLLPKMYVKNQNAVPLRKLIKADTRMADIAQEAMRKQQQMQQRKEERLKQASSYGRSRSVSKTAKPPKMLIKLARKHKIRVTVKRGSKRVYKSAAVLQKQLEKKN